MTEPEAVDGARAKPAPLVPGTTWTPVIGEEVNQLALPPGSERQIEAAASRILGSCVCPREQTDMPATNVGLVVGYVQSGKTANFIATIAMARDNGFPLIILLAGSSVNLVKQTRARIESARGLRLADRSDRQWYHIPFDIKDPDNNGSRVAATLRAHLPDWLDADIPYDERRTILLTVMKHHAHLEALAEHLEAFAAGSTLLRQITALVIDDEADQISLNSKVQAGAESANYMAIDSLRRRLPRHSYLQVTATPQAPLLVRLADRLSPDFVKVLDPGPGYTGGTTFYPDRATPLVQTIPSNEQFGPDDLPQAIPSTLSAATQQYLVTAAAWLESFGSKGNCSMMVHPDRKTVIHGQYARWLKTLLIDWKDLLTRPDEPDYEALIEGLQDRYTILKENWHLSRPALRIPSFEAIQRRLERLIAKVKVTTVNAVGGKTPQVDWRQEQFHILVGGASLDRGFTVEGLVVSYMPRSLGVGNADTLQQRARFFGYKEHYLGFCMQWLPLEVANAYRDYVRHEENMRSQLKRLEEEGRPLSTWRRSLLLDAGLRPTRRSVIDMKLDWLDLSGREWLEVRRLHLQPSGDDARSNGTHLKVSAAIADLAKQLQAGHLTKVADSASAATARHLQGRLTCEDLLQFTTQLQLADASEADFLFAAELTIRDWIERDGRQLSDEPCEVFIMGPAFDGHRKRNQDALGTIALQQGRSGSSKGDSNYPGDKFFVGREGERPTVTLQLFRLQVSREGKLLYPDTIWTMALYLPEHARARWVLEHQN